MDGAELKHRFGRKVQELREAKGLTQEGLAGLIGRSVDTVSNIERGVNATRIETAYQLAGRLDVPMHALFDLEDPPDPEAANHQASWQRDLQPILDLLQDVEGDTLLRLKDLVEAGLRLARRA